MTVRRRSVEALLRNRGKKPVKPATGTRQET